MSIFVQTEQFKPQLDAIQEAFKAKDFAKFDGVYLTIAFMETQIHYFIGRVNRLQMYLFSYIFVVFYVFDMRFLPSH